MSGTDLPGVGKTSSLVTTSAVPVRAVKRRKTWEAENWVFPLQLPSQVSTGQTLRCIFVSRMSWFSLSWSNLSPKTLPTCSYCTIFSPVSEQGTWAKGRRVTWPQGGPVPRQRSSRTTRIGKIARQALRTPGTLARRLRLSTATTLAGTALASEVSDKARWGSSGAAAPTQGAHQGLAGHLQALGSGRAVLDAPHAFLLAGDTVTSQCLSRWVFETPALAEFP